MITLTRECSGSKQAPFQSVYGALVARGENVSLFIKRRCVDTQTKYWVPAEEGTSVDLQRFRTIDRAAEAAAHQEQIDKARTARRRVNDEKAAGNHKGPAEKSSSAAEPEQKKSGGFGSKLKKLFSKSKQRCKVCWLILRNRLNILSTTLVWHHSNSNTVQSSSPLFNSMCSLFASSQAVNR